MKLYSQRPIRSENFSSSGSESIDKLSTFDYQILFTLNWSQNSGKLWQIFDFEKFRLFEIVTKVTETRTGWSQSKIDFGFSGKFEHFLESGTKWMEKNYDILNEIHVQFFILAYLLWKLQVFQNNNSVYEWNKKLTPHVKPETWKYNWRYEGAKGHFCLFYDTEARFFTFFAESFLSTNHSNLYPIKSQINPELEVERHQQQNFKKCTFFFHSNNFKIPDQKGKEKKVGPF